MKALTLWRPWPWAIFHAPHNPKLLENRGWLPPAYIIGKPIVLHAGKTFDKGAVDDIVTLTTPPGKFLVLPAEADAEGLIGVVTVTGYVPNAASAEVWSRGQGEWFSGPYAWKLSNERAFKEPIPCKGKQGLWDLPPWAEALVLKELR